MEKDNQAILDEKCNAVTLPELVKILPGLVPQIQRVERMIIEDSEFSRAVYRLFTVSSNPEFPITIGIIPITQLFKQGTRVSRRLPTEGSLFIIQPLRNITRDNSPVDLDQYPGFQLKLRDLSDWWENKWEKLNSHFFVTVLLKTGTLALQHSDMKMNTNRGVVSLLKNLIEATPDAVNKANELF